MISGVFRIKALAVDGGLDACGVSGRRGLVLDGASGRSEAVSQRTVARIEPLI
jgi:hypothetical protein